MNRLNRLFAFIKSPPLSLRILLVMAVVIVVIGRAVLPASAACGSTNIALNRAVTASTSQSGLPVTAAVDGNLTTRWGSEWADPQWVQIDLGSTQTLCGVKLTWEAAYGRSYRIETSPNASTWTQVYATTTGDGGVDTISFANTSARYIRMYGTVRATGWGYSLFEFEVFNDTGTVTNTPTPTRTPTATSTRTPTATSTSSTPNPCSTSNIALNKTATSSSNEAAGMAANFAVDGNSGTRWASLASDPQWIMVDLGGASNICRVRLNWEAAFGRSYQIQTSNNATDWTNVYTTTTGDGGIDDITGLNVNARYVRMHGTARGTGYGYSLWDFEIYGTGGVSGPDLTITAMYIDMVGRQPSGCVISYGALRVYVVIHNIGTGNAGTFVVDLNGVQQTVASLAAGTTTVLNFAPIPSGNYTATVDFTNLIAEINETNNTRSFLAPTPTPPPLCTPTPTSTTPPPTTPPPGCGTTNIALNKTATSSSNENAGMAANFAVDGNTGTRWSSAASDPQWLMVDLGSTQSICRVRLSWEAAYGRSYQIQVSANGTSGWTNIYSTTTSDGGIDDLTGLAGSGRYIRMNGTARATIWGYSLWEMEVFSGSGTVTPTPTNTPTPTPTQPGNWTTIFSDDFSGAANTSPNGTNWLLRTGTQNPGGAANWGTGEVETASASTQNVYLDGAGHLQIRAIRDGGGAWTSGRVESQRTDFMANPGEMIRFSAILQQPNVANAAGYWPGFRVTGAAYRGNYNNWPMVGEADIMTNVNGRSQNANTLHCGTAPGGVCNEYTGKSSGFATCTGCQTGYHEYSMIIDRTKTDEEVRFYLDGAQTWIVRKSQVGIAAWNDAINHGFFMSFVLSIGGSLPNAIAGYTTPTELTTSGGILSIDSVTVAKSTGTVPAAMTDPGIPGGPSVVRVTGTQGNWQLQVNGANYLIKGITYGPPQQAADAYMRDLQAMGVNTIRLWGVDDANTPYLLNTAARHGIKVIVGHWLNQGADYVNDAAYKTAVKNEIVARVNALKGYQGVLMWDVGNEVILTMQDFGLPAADVEARRVAYAQFVNEVTVAIHAADANHPVTSTDAWTGAWPYYRTHSPALDLLAVNSYGAIGTVKQDWINGGYNKPYIITEGGPAGEWEVPNDVNGVPTEPTDIQKRDGYTFNWNSVIGHPGVALGATEFHYGLEDDFGGVWLNTFNGGWRRLGYHALRQAYTGQASPNTPPQITSMTVSNQTSVPAGSQFNVSVSVTDPNGDPIRYNVMLSNKHINGNRGFSYATFTQTGNGTFSVTAPQEMGVWKVYVYAYDGQGNVGIETKSFRVVPPTVPGTNIAIGKAATASTYQPTGTNGPQLPSYAVDGNYTTRWASEWADPQWIQIDLGSVQTFNTILLAWETSYGKGYRIETSNDGVNWTQIYGTTTGDGGFDQISVNGNARYVRMYGTVRGTGWGYSLWEFGIYR